MKNFEELTELEQNEIIIQIASKLDKQEIWYWEGLVHLLREQDKRINKAIEYINSEEMLKLREDFEYCNDKDLFDEFAGHLDRILRGSDKE